MKARSNYYVYGYFDPRSYELFYVGKGKDSRKDAHLSDKAGTEKERRIAEIKKALIEPNVKVIATDLTENEAFLVEKALIWKSGKSLTNRNGGKFRDKFRPPNTLHLLLPGFDFVRNVFYVNVGAHFGPHRQWEDCFKYNFVSAGGEKHSSQLFRLSVGDIVASYISKKGYVGIGRVVSPPVRSKDFRHRGHRLTRQMLKGPDLLHDENNLKKCEYLVGVRWIKKVHKENAWIQKGLFATPHVVASLSRQPETLEFLEQQSGIKFEKLLAAK